MPDHSQRRSQMPTTASHDRSSGPAPRGGFGGGGNRMMMEMMQQRRQNRMQRRQNGGQNQGPSAVTPVEVLPPEPTTSTAGPNLHPGFNADTGRGRTAAWTTGGPSGNASVELARDGSWTSDDFLQHHSDRSNSWAANQIRNAKNQDLQAYDFTFEKVDQSGNPVLGSAQGYPLISHSDSTVLDIQHDYKGSGGLGKFIVLEDVETGERISVHHLDAVGEFEQGQVIQGGTTFGTQGSSGNSKHVYAPHVDIIGTEDAVSQFVLSNQTGQYRTRENGQ